MLEFDGLENVIQVEKFPQTSYFLEKLISHCFVKYEEDKLREMACTKASQYSTNPQLLSQVII